MRVKIRSKKLIGNLHLSTILMLWSKKEHQLLMRKTLLSSMRSKKLMRHCLAKLMKNHWFKQWMKMRRRENMNVLGLRYISRLHLKDKGESKRKSKEKLRSKLNVRDWSKWENSSVEKSRSNGNPIGNMRSSIGRKLVMLLIILSRITHHK